MTQCLPRCLMPSLGCNELINTLRPRQNGRHFPDAIFKWIFLNENVWISIKISLNFVPKGPINNIPSLVQIMAWRRPGDKPLSEPVMVSLPTHICVTRPQWVKDKWHHRSNSNKIKSKQDFQYHVAQNCNFVLTKFQNTVYRITGQSQQ